MIYIYLSIGAVAGTLARYLLGVWISQMHSDAVFPWGTFVINVTGSFLLGFLMRYLVATPASREVRAMLTTGFCGGYTTFSTFSYEAVNLFIEGQTSTALLYGGGSFVVAPIACYLGYMLAGAIL